MNFSQFANDFINKIRKSSLYKPLGIILNTNTRFSFFMATLRALTVIFNFHVLRLIITSVKFQLSCKSCFL